MDSALAALFSPAMEVPLPNFLRTFHNVRKRLMMTGKLLEGARGSLLH